jgi:WD40 repeat protein
MSGTVSGQSLWTGPRQDPRRYRVDLTNGALHAAGDGGEGLVYRAVTITDGAAREVALKMHTTLAIADFDRLNERARILLSVDHPHVMHLVDAFIGTALVDTEDPNDADFNVIYTVAEWIPGDSLVVARASAGPVHAMHWTGELARGVAYLHAWRGAAAPAGMVHRDITPTNIRITPSGTAVLIDFGIARPHEAGDMTRGAGTYLWQAPETVGGPGTPASDAWGIGAVAFWMLSGGPPPAGGPDVVRARLAGLARQAGFSDPVGLARHVARLLEPRPGQRTQDLNRWADELDAIVAGARPHRWSSAAVEGLINHSRLAVGVLSLIVVLAVVITTAAVYVGRRDAQNLAQAGELAAQSVNTLPTDVKLGSLLSVEAAALAQTTQTHDAVVDALEQPVDKILSTGHGVTSVAVSPIGAYLAEGTGDEVVLWNTATGQEIGHELSHTGPVTSVAFSPTGTIFAAAEGDDVVLWNTATGQTFTQPVAFRHRVTDIAFSPDGDATLAIGEGTDVVLWDTVTSAPLGQPLVAPASVTSVALSQSGIVAAGDATGTVMRWDGTTGADIGHASVGSGPVPGVAFSPDNSMLAAVEGDYIVVSNTETGAPVGMPLPDGNQITSIEFNPAVGSELASGTRGGNVVLWTIVARGGTTPTATFDTLGVGADVSGVAFRADGTRLAVADTAGDTTLWNMDTPIEDSTPDGAVVTSVAAAPAGTTVATGDTGGDVTLWNAADGAEIGPALHVDDSLSSVAFDAGGRILAAGGASTTVTLWNIADRSVTRRLTTPSDVYSVAFSPDGTMLASGDSGGEVMLWAGDLRQQHALVPKRRSSVRSVAFSPDGHLLAAGDDLGRVVLWNTATGRQIGRLTDGSKVNSVAFSPDGTLLATGDDAGNVEVWDVATRQKVDSLDDRSSVNSVAFSPNGRTVATGDALGDVIPWDIASGTEIGPSLVDRDSVDGVAFDRSGSALVSGDDGGDVVVFPSSFLSAPTATIVQQLCGRIRGNLTRTQWSQYLPHTPYRPVCPAYP